MIAIACGDHALRRQFRSAARRPRARCRSSRRGAPTPRATRVGDHAIRRSSRRTARRSATPADPVEVKRAGRRLRRVSYVLLSAVTPTTGPPQSSPATRRLEAIDLDQLDSASAPTRPRARGRRRALATIGRAAHEVAVERERARWAAARARGRCARRHGQRAASSSAARSRSPLAGAEISRGRFAGDEASSSRMHAGGSDSLDDHVAMPMPPPMHSVISAVDLFERSRKLVERRAEQGSRRSRRADGRARSRRR